MKPVGIFERVDDALNPIVVEELRQAVKSWFVVGVVLLFLALQLTLLGIFLVQDSLREVDTAETFQAGRTVFAILQGILLGTCMLFLPAYIGGRLGAERSDVNVDLLFVSTLSPRSIIWGKFLSGLILAALIFSACAPFMTFTYLLRGIDLPLILLTLGIDFLVVAGSVQFAILIASFAVPRMVKLVMALGGIVALLFLFAGTIALTAERLNIAQFSTENPWSIWGPIIGCMALALLVVGLLFAWSVALISPPAANRALPVRLFLVFMWLSSAAIFIGFDLVTGERISIIWLVMGCVLACLNLVIAINEREHWSPRMARTIPGNALLRLGAFLMYSGAAGGVLFSILMMAGTILGSVAWDDAFPYFFGGGPRVGPRTLQTPIRVMGLIGLYTLSYALTAVWVRNLLSKWVNALFTWLIGAALLGIGSVVPLLIGLFWNYGTMSPFQSYYYWLLGNPFATVIDERRHDESLMSIGIWAGIAFLINVPWCFRQWRAFRPYNGPSGPLAARVPGYPLTAAPVDAESTRTAEARLK